MNDILLNDNDEVLVTNGDFTVGFSDQQHQKHLILIEKGEIKRNVTAGVGAMRYLESEKEAELLREIVVQFNGDGIQINNISIDSTGVIKTEASYK